MKSMLGLLISALVLGATMLAGAPAMGASHSWRVNELFSDSSGTIQFIELKEINGNSAEHALAGKSVESLGTGSILNFPGNISGNTAYRHLLLGTTGFAALPGAPAPDYTIADGFFDISSDTVRYNPYHSFAFAVAALPTDGANSIQVTNYTTNAFTTGTNSPTNYAGEAGSVHPGGGVCTDNDSDGYGAPGDASCSNGSATDCNDADATISPGAIEVCADSIDNDCDDSTDCADPDCEEDPACSNSVPAVPTWGMIALMVVTLAMGLSLIHRSRSSSV